MRGDLRMKINRLLSIAAVIACFSLNPTAESCNPLTAAQLKNAKSFENVQIERGDDGNGVVPSRSINSGKSFAQDPGAGGGGTPDSSDRKVKASDLRENMKESLASFRGLSVRNALHSESWRGDGLIGHYMKIDITSIYRINGVYSHFPAYFDYNILKSGSVQASVVEAGEFKDTYSESLSFSFAIDGRVEKSLNAGVNLDDVSLSGSMQLKGGAAFTYDCSMTRFSTFSYRWSKYFSISSATADYCPDGYALSIGKQGTYYVIKGNYQDYTNWWWGDYPTSGSESKEFTAVFANPPISFTHSFIN